MKKVSARMFFSVVWMGICQAMGWFFGLFGYNRDGKFAKCVWGLFSVSAAIVMAVLSGVLLVNIYQALDDEYEFDLWHSDDCEYDSRLSCSVMIHNREDGKAWVMNQKTGKKTLTDIVCIQEPYDQRDSLVMFYDGKKCGYFSKYSGEVVIPAKYDRASSFSEGIAGVVDDGIIKFIDPNDNQVFERTFVRKECFSQLIFICGYCVIDEDGDHKYGMIDTNGVTVLPEEYDTISCFDDLGLWTIYRDGKCSVIDKNLNTILPLMAWNVYVFDDGIDVIMPDNTMRKYDLDGNLIDDFYILSFEHLEYELEETCKVMNKVYDEDEYDYEYVSSTEHKKAWARLAKYIAGNEMEGLMTQEGHMVTLPKYMYIEAIGPDTYLCTVNRSDKEILNGKGEKVR